jgi:hypothetical protein
MGHFRPSHELSLRVDVRFDPKSYQDRATSQHVAMDQQRFEMDEAVNPPQPFSLRLTRPRQHKKRPQNSPRPSLSELQRGTWRSPTVLIPAIVPRAVVCAPVPGTESRARSTPARITTPGTGLTSGTRAVPSCTGATRTRLFLHGTLECVSSAAGLTSRSDPVRGSVHRPAGSAPIAMGLA